MTIKYNYRKARVVPHSHAATIIYSMMILICYLL